MKVVSFILVCLVVTTEIQSQPFDRWAETVGWDGISHWSRYMITKPAFQGPNALPVPGIGNGTADSISYLGMSGNLHFSPGDQTQNLVFYGNYCLVKNIVSINASWIPMEHFVLSDSIITKRHIFTEFFHQNWSVGDVLFSTNIQLLNKWRNKIHLALRIGYRFPSGSGDGSARNVDGPGYYFDLSYGKPFNNSSLKLIGMFGFYVWQIDGIHKFGQNDAFLFGTGLEVNKRNIRIETSVSGYLGWMNEGDKPIIFRTRLERSFAKISLIAGYQQGLHDFNYSSVEAGLNYRFAK